MKFLPILLDIYFGPGGFSGSGSGINKIEIINFNISLAKAIEQFALKFYPIIEFFDRISDTISDLLVKIF